MILLKKLEEREALLIEEKERRSDIITKYGIQIMNLWDILHIPQEERESFFDLLGENSLGLKAIEMCKCAIATLENQKVQKIKDLINEAKIEIKLLWDRRHVSENERKQYSFFTSEEISEDILSQINLSISKLKEEIEKSTPIMELITKRNELIEKQKRA